MSIAKNYLYLIICFLLVSCQEQEKPARNVPLEEIAGNEEVKAYMAAFKGMGIMSDSSNLPSPEATLQSFEVPEDLEIELLLAEPQVNQPVEVNFDHRGRLWVVQYNQYPYPEGVKIVDIDNHVRAVFDKIPNPPANGVKGADKITIYEDTDGDGSYDQSTDAITGLNITTGITLGRGKIWVLTPPYLVAYPDPDGDGIPNGEAEVHLSGFGLEDTHAVANSLRWGPDGWLYGAQGSTTIANINSAVSKDVHFKGQAIWRYHPETNIFEIFGEGGGNTFDTEFDAKGRMYSGDNGTTRGFYYKQGGYYRKNWGKHGALTNPYAFGYLPGLAVEGKKMRFTHAWIKYEGGSLPKKYHDKIMALNPLHNFIQLSRPDPVGSTFLCVDEEKMLTSSDHWFRPVDIKAGPDGAVYLADWSDSRLSHVSPIDTWNKRSGRIYRIKRRNQAPAASFDLSTYNNEDLIALLTNKNKWFRQQALRLLGDRKEASLLPELLPLFREGDGQTALEALWAIHLSGGFSDEIAQEAIDHTDPYVRLWGIRLLGDHQKVSSLLADELAKLAASEQHLEVIGQLASSAKRFPAEAAIPILNHLMQNAYTQQDQDNQLLIWWALESKAESGRANLLALFENPTLWAQPMVQEIILERLMQRYILAGGKQNYLSGAALFELAPSDDFAQLLLIGLEEGLRGKGVEELPEELSHWMRYYQAKFGEGELNLALRQNDQSALSKALVIIADPNANRLERLSYIKTLGEIDQPQAVPVLLKIAANNNHPVAIRLACFQALQHYNDPSIGEELRNAYAHNIRSNSDVRLAAFRLFASRADWAKAFLTLVYETKAVKKGEVPDAIIRQFKLLGDEPLNRKVDELWPSVKLASSDEKTAAVLKIKEALTNGTGNVAKGKVIYTNSCESCHLLNGEGGVIGPDLTGYDRTNLNYLILNIVDPNADIREGYVTYMIEKKDGQILLGTLLDRTEALVTVRTLSGEEITLAQSEIKAMTSQKTSMMPERLMEPLGEQEIRDLFAYLAQ